MEFLLHLLPELINGQRSGAGGDQVIDFDDQSVNSPAPRVLTMFGTAPLETKPCKHGVELAILGPGHLPQAIQGIAQVVHFIFVPSRDKTERLLDVDHFSQHAIEEGALHLHVVDGPPVVRHQ
jgi:hypothetical protein